MRTELPAKAIPKPPILTLLKDLIGKDLIRISMPVVLNEPLSFLQKACEVIQYYTLLQKANEQDDPVKRIEYICAFITASISNNSHRLRKPFNPLLYETYENEFVLEDGSVVRAIIQQVSHHPPITAGHFHHKDFQVDCHICPKIKFWGKSIEIFPEGESTIYLPKSKSRYVFNGIPCSIHNILIGKLWFEHVGKLQIKCFESEYHATLNFHPAGWINGEPHKFDGYIMRNGKKVRYLCGKWTEKIESRDDAIATTESDLLWKQEATFFEDYYNFTHFTMSLNELTPELEARLPRTDSRLRPDIRYLENGDVNMASVEKKKLEEKQRNNRAKDPRFKAPSSDFLWFDLKDVPFTKDKFWVFNGLYWNAQKDSEKFPDFF